MIISHTTNQSSITLNTTVIISERDSLEQEIEDIYMLTCAVSRAESLFQSPLVVL